LHGKEAADGISLAFTPHNNNFAQAFFFCNKFLFDRDFLFYEKSVRQSTLCVNSILTRAEDAYAGEKGESEK
jgi:hypothetical protein